MRLPIWAALAAALAACGDADSTPARADADAGEARGKVYVDVRTPQEFAAGHLDGAINIPVETIETRWPELEPHRGDSIIVYCRTGRRSAAAIQVLDRQGFDFLRNGGGLDDVRNGR